MIYIIVSAICNSKSYKEITKSSVTSIAFDEIKNVLKVYLYKDFLKHSSILTDYIQLKYRKRKVRKENIKFFY